MLTMTDCVAFSGLTSDQVDAVACFKHIPAIIAAEWAETALETPEGCAQVADMLEAEATLAQAHHLACAKAWQAACTQFRADHPARRAS